MAKPYICDVSDWDIQAHGDALVMRPSGRTIARQLWLTLLCAVLIGLLFWFVGLPPGAYKVSHQREVVQRHERHVVQSEKHAARLRASASPAMRGMAQTAEQQLAIARQELQRERDRLAQTQPTLGPVGDALVWGAAGLLALVGVAVPLSGFMERVTLTYDGHDQIRIQPRWSFIRSLRFRPSDYGAIGIFVQRLIYRHHRSYTRTQDLGWRWSIVLAPKPGSGARPVEIRPEHEPSLPVRVADLTPKVRAVVSLLERATGLRAHPPVEADVMDLQPGLWGTRIKHGVRRHAWPVHKA